MSNLNINKVIGLSTYITSYNYDITAFLVLMLCNLDSYQISHILVWSPGDTERGAMLRARWTMDIAGLHRTEPSFSDLRPRDSRSHIHSDTPLWNSTRRHEYRDRNVYLICHIVSAFVTG